MKIIIILAASLLLPINAHAYIDPGTGSIVLQAIFAAFFGALFTIKMWWRSAAAFFARLFGKGKPSDV